MLTKFKKFIMKYVALYHEKMANYYFGKVDAYGPDNNEHWMKKVTYHVNKEFGMYKKILVEDI